MSRRVCCASRMPRRGKLARGTLARGTRGRGVVGGVDQLMIRSNLDTLLPRALIDVCERS